MYEVKNIITTLFSTRYHRPAKRLLFLTPVEVFRYI